MYFPETATWHSLKPINTPVVEPQNEFSGARAVTFPYDSDVQVCQRIMTSARHLIGINVMEDCLEKLSGIILLIVCANFSLTICLLSSLFHLFYTYGKAIDKSCVVVSPDPVFIREKILRPI